MDTFSLSAAILDAIQKHPEEAKYPRDLRNVIEETLKAFLAERSIGMKISTQP